MVLLGVQLYLEYCDAASVPAVALAFRHEYIVTTLSLQCLLVSCSTAAPLPASIASAMYDMLIPAMLAWHQVQDFESATSLRCQSSPTYEIAQSSSDRH
eukprot:jgi/Chrzof1/3860/Cz13g11140.t1